MPKRRGQDQSTADAADRRSSASSQTYEIGYGKPPKETQFKPGKSGNPKGRKNGTVSVSKQLADILQRGILVTEGGRSRRMTLQEVMFNSIANKAAKGDLKSAQFLLNVQEKYRASEVDTLETTDLQPDDQAIIADFLGQLTETPPDKDAE